MIIEIALGIVLAVIILALLPLIAAGAIVIVGLVVVAALIYLAFTHSAATAAIAVVAAVFLTLVGLQRYFDKKKLPINVAELLIVPFIVWGVGYALWTHTYLRWGENQWEST